MSLNKKNSNEYRKGRIKTIRNDIIDCLHRSTFHGVEIILELKNGWIRILMICYVIICFAIAVVISMYSFLSFLNFPYKTLINYEQGVFQFPTITICPLSPFSEFDLSNAPSTLLNEYEKLVKFWESKGKFQNQVKRSFTKHYYENEKYLQKKWYELFIGCQYNGKSCLGNIKSLEHPMMYRCFQIQLDDTFRGSRSGTNRGLKLFMYQNKSSRPMLSINENSDQIFDKFSSSQTNKQNGILFVIHVDDETPITKLSALPNSHSMIYGQRAALIIKATYYKQTHTLYHPCLEKVKSINFILLSKYLIDSRIDEQALHVLGSRSNCAAILRQKYLSEKCHCFSEYNLIPYAYRNKFKQYGFCHNITDFNVDYTKRIECVSKIERMTDDEIIKILKKKKGLDYFTKYLRKCVTPCDRYIHEVMNIHVEKLKQPSFRIDLFKDYEELLEKKTIPNPFKMYNMSSLNSSDILILDISGQEERIAVLDEDLDKNVGNFIADVGGAFGLIVGISGITVFEILEVYYLFMMILYFKLNK